MSDALLFFPEICVLISCLILFGISVADFSYNFVWRISVLLSGLVLAACLVTLTAQGQPFFPGIYAVDGFSQLLKLGIALGLSLTLLVSGISRASARAPASTCRFSCSSAPPA